MIGVFATSGVTKYKYNTHAMFDGLLMVDSFYSLMVAKEIFELKEFF